MFRFHKTLDVLTLFHAPKNPQSTRVLALLRAASEQATDSGITGKNPTAQFELDVVEEPGVPTPTQLQSILEFVGKDKISQIVRGTSTVAEASKVLDAGDSMRVLRPLLVDWNNGRAVIGADEKAIKNIVETLPT